MKYNHVEYFENIARNLKLLSHTDESKHFFTATSILQLQELLSSLSVAQYPALIAIDKRDGRLLDDLSSNLIDQQFYQVIILTPADGLSSSDRNTASDTSFSIFRSIISRMTKDKLADSRVSVYAETTGLRNFNRNEVQYNSVGPILDNLFGIEFTFTLQDRLISTYVDAEWYE